jgi:hypothetical protein
MIEAANAMLGSEEFTGKFGPVASLSDSAFVEILYATAFERDADVGGLNYWLDRLASGMSRGEIALSFSASAEAHDEFASTIKLIHKDDQT